MAPPAVRDFPAPLPWRQRIFAISNALASHRGVRIEPLTFNAEREAIVLGKVRAALDIIADTCPYRLAQLVALPHAVVVARLPAALGSWRRDLNVVCLDTDFVASDESTPAHLATILIHELTHARLERLGISYTAANRVRCERICHLAERNFVARLPESREKRRLQEINARYLNAPKSYWSDRAHEDRLTHWRATLPVWRRLVHDIMTVILTAHRGARANDR